MPAAYSRPQSARFEDTCASIRKYAKSRNKYKRCFVKWRDHRRRNVNNLRLLVTDLEETKHNCNITGLSSSVGGIVGGVLTGVSLILLPFSRKYTYTFVEKLYSLSRKARTSRPRHKFEQNILILILRYFLG